MTQDKRLALVAAIMGSFVVGLDSTVVNVALPAIERDLGGGLAAQQWISNAYLLALGSLILVGGSLGDVFGERRIFSLGVAGFGVTSLLCALAPTIGVLVAGRALQGVFGALLTPSALAVIIATFPTHERGKAVGSWTAWTSMAMVFGPLAGGKLVDAADWRWIFAVNIPFVVVTLVLVRLAVPRRERAVARVPVDFAGAGLSFAGLAGPVFALIRQPALGWTNPAVLGPLVAGVVVFGLFLAREARTPHPMLPLGLFRRRNFAVGNAETLTLYAGLSILFFMLPLFLQQVAGYEALQAGMATLPVTLVMFTLSRRAGALAGRFGARVFMGGGPLLMAVGLLLLLRVDAELTYWTDVLPGLMVFAIGLSCTVAPLTATVLADADESNAGIASATNNAVARVAGLLGIAVLGAVVAATFTSSSHDGAARAGIGPAGRAALSAAGERTFARANVSRVPSGERAQVSAVALSASESALHTAVLISAGLVAAGGLLGFAGIREPRGTVCCEDGSGGQSAARPVEVAPRPTAPATRRE